MFTDLFQLIRSLEHDFKEESGKQVHAYGCRRSAIAARLNGLKVQVLQLQQDVEFAIGEPIEKNK